MLQLRLFRGEMWLQEHGGDTPGAVTAGPGQQCGAETLISCELAAWAGTRAGEPCRVNGPAHSRAPAWLSAQCQTAGCGKTGRIYGCDATTGWEEFYGLLVGTRAPGKLYICTS